MLAKNTCARREGRGGEGRGGREEEEADGEIGRGKERKRQKRGKRRGEDNELQWANGPALFLVAGHCTQDQN